MFTPAAPAAKKNFGQAVTTIIGLAVGIGCAEVVDLFGGFGATSVYTALLEIAVGLLLGFFLSIAAHEAGHLVFGLMTGYGFVSYRVGSLTIVRSDSKLKIRRMKLAGTGGQCLMSPPEMKDGKYPFVLYQLGGAIFNLVFSAVFISVAVAVSGPQALRVILADIGLINLATALTNGIPLRLGAVDNDGRNALSLGKNSAALAAMHTQLSIAAAGAKGQRLRDMPEEWFTMPDEKDMDNTLVATIAVFRANRIMDSGDISGAEPLIRSLVGNQAVIGLHRQLLACDLACADYLSGKKDEAERLLSASETVKIMQSMPDFPSVIRTRYFEALFGDFGPKDKRPEPEKLRERLEKIAKTYPNPADIESELELMELADRKAAEAS